MPGPRQPIDVLKARGAKHLTKGEEAERRASELNIPQATKITPPKWLGRDLPPDVSKALKSEFRKLGKRLAEVGLYTDLDADTLGQYLVALHQWELATRQMEGLLGDVAYGKQAKLWAEVQAKYFAAARRCASEMGLTISSRCRLIVPQAAEPDEPEDEFTRRLKERQRAASGA